MKVTIKGVLIKKLDVERGMKHDKEWTKEVFAIQDDSNPQYPQLYAFTSMNRKGNVADIPIGSLVEVTAFIGSNYSKNPNTGKEMYFTNMSVQFIQVLGANNPSQPQPPIWQENNQAQYSANPPQYAQPQQPPQGQRVVTPQGFDDGSDLPF